MDKLKTDKFKNYICDITGDLTSKEIKDITGTDTKPSVPICKFEKKLDMSRYNILSTFTTMCNGKKIDFDIMEVPKEVYDKGKNIGFIRIDKNKWVLETFLFTENPFNMSYDQLLIPNNDCSYEPPHNKKYDISIGACESKEDDYEQSSDTKFLTRKKRK